MIFARQLISAAILIAVPVTASPAQMPPARLCPIGDHGPTISLTVSGLKRNSGIINIFLYGGQPKEWLSKDHRVARLWYDAPPSGDFHVCIPVPEVGRYGLVIHHDANRDLRRDGSDGIGYSKNPSLSLFNLKPNYNEAAIMVQGATPVNIVMQYRFGLSIHPATFVAR